MTESKAWGYLAKCWGKAYKTEFVYYASILGVSGLCRSCQVLDDTGKISFKVKQSMICKIAKLPNRNLWSAYKWSFKRSGAKARANFCRKMAKATKGVKL